MKIVIAPDSFKGSINARELCASIKEGDLRVFPQAGFIELPLADGGEGTMENMVTASNGTIYKVKVTGPYGRPVHAAYGVLGDGKTVVIEMAQASGLPLVIESEKNPLHATGYGTGELIRYALDQGYRQFVIGIGGSATNDVGTGMLKALGMEFYDRNGIPLPQGGGFLRDLYSMDDTQFDPRVKEASFTVACDVTNPLCGPEGASAVFGPQKGATPEMVKHLDACLNYFADIVLKQKGMEIRSIPGVGAAGGMGSALVAFLQAELKQGIEVVMEAMNVRQHLKEADLLITGEGKLDFQTLSGKGIAGISRQARHYNIPVIAICGAMDLTGDQLDMLQVTAAFSIVPGPCSLEQAFEHTSSWAGDRTEQILRLFQFFRSN
ncbi:glycerate kinase [Effusibacillus consociatus]|uniref:Glycerate kinase n=1 Tax=Effusibacillus consociatus TaxID=1117041 RepID=A0ABV9PWY6_9BACL